MNRKKLKSLTLIETMVAATVFSIMSVSLFFFLRSGILLRKKIELGQLTTQGIYLNLERIAQELRNTISFRSQESGFKGEAGKIEFYSLLFDYSVNQPKILHIAYNFEEEEVLTKTVYSPFKDDTLRTFDFFEKVEKVSFYYFDSKTDKWHNEWQEAQRLPQGVKIELVYKDENGKEFNLDKYVFIDK